MQRSAMTGNLRNKIISIEKSNWTEFTLFTWVNSVCMPIFTVNRKGTTKFYTEKKRMSQLYIGLPNYVLHTPFK